MIGATVHATTDDLGQYRLPALPPGEYYIAGEALPSPANRLRVSGESIAPDTPQSGAALGDDNGLVKADGRFTLSGVVGSSAIRLLSLPRGWAVKSIEGGDRDLAESPVELRGGQALDVRIVVTNRFPDVSGRITDDRGAPVEGTVLLFPADAARWYDSALRRTARPDQSGVFRVQTVRPGEYLALAMEFVEPWQVNDPEFLEEMSGRATRISVREGQPQSVSLKVVR